MDKKTWVTIIGLAASMATNYVQHGSVLAKQEETNATAAALSRLAEAYEGRIACE